MSEAKFFGSETSTYGPAIQGAHWIGGEFLSGSDHFESKNPANLSDQVGKFPKATSSEIESAVKAANEAFATWRKVPAPIRGAAIGRLGRVLEREKESLAKILTRDIGKPYKESLGEVQEAIDTAQFFQSEGRRLYGQTVPSELPNKELFTYRRPLGVCLMITASNFPFAVPSWKMIPALLCGNTVIWKPSQDATAIGLAFALCFAEAGFPKGVVNFVSGDGKTGEDLLSFVEKGGIHKVSFTGSTNIGKKVGEICGRNIQTPSLELGGKNPLILHEDANLDKAIPTTLVSTYGTAGQRCTSTGNIIVHEKIYDEFKDRFLKAISEIKIGNPLEQKDILYGPMFAERYLENFMAHLDWVAEEGGTLLTKTKGQITKDNPYPQFFGDPESGWYVHPALWEDITIDKKFFSTEVFGPTVGLVKVKDFDHAMELANAHPYGLSSAIFTENPHLMLRFKEEIQAGMSSINNSTTGAEAHLPFGGIKNSGNGTRESGIWVLESYTRWHCVNVDLAPDLQLAQMDVDYGEATGTQNFSQWVTA